MLEQEELSVGVRTLLQSVILSIEMLDVLLLLQRDGDHRWSIAQLAEETRLPLESVEDALGVLSQHGLVGSAGDPMKFMCKPRDGRLAQHVAELSALCTSRRMDVMLLISSNAINRVRAGALFAFSDALGLTRRRQEE